jgi:hypothetical protein
MDIPMDDNINMDLFGDDIDDAPAGTTTNNDTNAANPTDDLTFDLSDNGKLDMMNLDLPGIDSQSGMQGDAGTQATENPQVSTAPSQQTDLSALQINDGASFDEMMASLGNDTILDDSGDYSMFGEEFNNLYGDM